MMDAANESESWPKKLAHRELNMILRSAHTTTISGTHVMYDLCAMPSYFEPLKEELVQLLQECGWDQTVLIKMRKMDSFLKES